MIRKITLLFLLCIGLYHVASAQDFVVISVTSGHGSDTACAGTPVTFQAQSNDVTATYQWFVDNVATGITSTTFTTASLIDGDQVFCRLYFMNGGNPDSVNSDTVTMHVFSYVNPDVTIALTNGFNPGCPMSTLTFTATNVNSVPLPQYQWYLNGGAISGATDDTYTSTLFLNGDIISCTLMAGTPCATPDTAFSNQVPIIRALETVTVTIDAVSNPACAGHNVVFTATPSANVGLSGQYQWFINGGAIAGATNSVFIDTVNNNDIVTCMLTDNDACVSNHTASSNDIIMVVNPSITPTITSAIIRGANPGCLDSVVVFAGTATNYGADPNFTWLVNGVPKAFTDTFSTDSLVNGDTVILRVNETDGGCYRPDTSFTAPIIMTLDTTPVAPLISLIGNHLIGNEIGLYIWYGPDGNVISGADSQVYHPTILGPYYVRTQVRGCLSQPSNIIIISLLGVDTYGTDQVKVYPNPTQGQVTLDWGTRSVNMKINVYNLLGQGLLHDEVNNQARKNLDLSALPNGSYFITLRDEDGSTATVKITLNR